MVHLLFKWAIQLLFKPQHGHVPTKKTLNWKCLTWHCLQEDAAESTVQVCVYCQDHCEADLFAQEPIWSCAWCRATTHVRCYRDFHADAIKRASEAQDPPASTPQTSGADSGQGSDLKLPQLDLDGSDGSSSRSSKRSR